jgi:hypothetical protein
VVVLPLPRPTPMPKIYWLPISGAPGIGRNCRSWSIAGMVVQGNATDCS